MGDGKILTGAIIAGIAIMLALSAMPAYAGHPNNCPIPGSSEVSAAVSDAAEKADRNGDGFVCLVPQAPGFIDNVIHP